MTYRTNNGQHERTIAETQDRKTETKTERKNKYNIKTEPNTKERPRAKKENTDTINKDNAQHKNTTNTDR